MQNAQGYRVNDERHLSEESCLGTGIDKLSDTNHKQGPQILF